jgi:glycosyltransferase involved in cell wall biosynthesis
VTNSLKKDPRVIKQIKIALENKFDVDFIGMMDENYDKEFLDSVGCTYTLINTKQFFGDCALNVWDKLKRRYLGAKMMYDRILESRPDVIHANDFDTLPSAYLAAKKLECAVVYDSHEIFAENIGIADKKLVKKLIIVAERYMIRRVDRVISVSHAAAKYLGNKYGIEEPRVITNCPYMVGVGSKKSKDEFEVLYHGWITRGRGYEEFVEAASLLGENEITFAIRGYGNILEKLVAIARAKKVTDRVRFYEPVEIAELVPEAATSSVGIVITKPVNLNFRLSVSNKLFEYLHAGLPVIMSDIDEHRYLNEKYHFGIILHDVTPKAIAEAAEKLYADSELYNDLKANAVKAADELCWQNEGLKLLEIYREAEKSNG